MVRRLWGALLGKGMVLLAQAAFAQSDSLHTKRLSLKISPQHLFVNCLNLELEQKLGSGRQAVVFSPRLYYGGTKSVDYLSGREVTDNISEVRGFGVELQHKFFRKSNIDPGTTVYFAYGVNYNRFELDYEKIGWVEEMQNDGLSYYTYKLAPFHEEIRRVGGLVMLGTQKSFWQNLMFVDLYSGLGYHKSTSDTQQQKSDFSNSIMDYGSTGLYLLAGVKIGVWLK